MTLLKVPILELPDNQTLQVKINEAVVTIRSPNNPANFATISVTHPGFSTELPPDSVAFTFPTVKIER